MFEESSILEILPTEEIVKRRRAAVSSTTGALAAALGIALSGIPVAPRPSHYTCGEVERDPSFGVTPDEDKIAAAIAKRERRRQRYISG